MIEIWVNNHHSAHVIDRVCQILVREEVAICVKDSREGDAQLERYIKDPEMIRDLREDNRERRLGVVVYNNYVVATKPSGSFEPHISVIRLWFDKHSGKAGIKISEEDLMALAQTMSVLHLLRKLDLSLDGNKDGKLNIQKIAYVMSQAVAKASPGVKAKFSVRRR